MTRATGDKQTNDMETPRASTINDTLAPYEGQIEERFVRGSGPGGQNVNKVATAVELRFDIGASSLPRAVQARLAVMAGSRVTIADPPGITALRATASRIVDSLGPGDLAAVTHTMYGGPQNFTSDRGRLKRAIDSSA